MNRHLVLPLGAVDAADVGMKAHNLNRLIALGYPVPRSAFVTVTAYRDFLVANRIDRQVGRVLEMAGAEPDEGRLQSALADIRQVILSGTLPERLTRALADWLASGEAAGGALAVRSSGVKEDLGDHSFAGQYASILQVAPEMEAVAQAIREVWASLWNWRNIAYQLKNGIPLDHQGIGVVVQEMVEAERAGVLFTRSPTGHQRDHLVMEYVEGLGEALVSGEATPRQVVLHRQSLAVVRGSDGAETEMARPVFQTLARRCVELEEQLGYACDVEWAVRGEALWFLQVRPITTALDVADSEVLWTDENVGEVIPDVVTPYSWSLLEPVTNGGFRFFLAHIGMRNYPPEGLFALYFGKVYFNSTAFNDTLSRFYISEHRKRFREAAGAERYRNLVGDVAATAMVGLRTAHFLTRVAAWIRGHLRRAPERIAALRSVPDMAPTARLEREGGLFALQKRTMELHISCTIFGEIYYQLLDKLCGAWFPGDPDVSADTLLAGLNAAESARTGVELWRLARTVAGHPEVAQRFREADPGELDAILAGLPEAAPVRDAIDAFIEEFGHGALHEFELIYPRWWEDRRYIYRNITAYLDTLDSRDPAGDREGLGRRRAEQTERVLAALGGPLGWVKRRLFTHILARARFFSIQRENLKQCLLRAHSELKKHLLALSDALNARGLTRERDDIFFLTREEIRHAVTESRPDPGLGQTVLVRRRDRHQFSQRRHPKRVRQIGEQWFPVAEDDGTGGTTFSGIGCSDGVVDGTARVITSPEDFDTMNPGDILIAPATNPGWTPLFVLAAGIVTEIGGALSHGAIIAREYGIPMAAAVPGITAHLRTGMHIRLNGTLGIVEVLEPITEDVHAANSDHTE